jgi:hypothetical protein
MSSLKRPRSVFAASKSAQDEPVSQSEDPIEEDVVDAEEITAPRLTFASPEYWTPERRKEQAERAKRMIVEGKFGSANGFHRRKTKPFQEIVAEKAQARADEIVTQLEAMIFSQSKDKRLQLEAIRELAKFETWAVQNSREDEREFRAMTNQQLDERLLMILGESLGLDLSVIEGTSVEEDALQLASGECSDCAIERQTLGKMLRDENAPEEMIERLVARSSCPEHRDLSLIGAARKNEDATS